MPHESLHNLLKAAFATAIARVAGTPLENSDPMVRAAGDPQFGDYQCNAAMSLAKTLKAKPRDVAVKIVAEVQPALVQIADPLEIAGPGFINIRLKPEFLVRYLQEIPRPPSAAPEEPLNEPATPTTRPNEPGAPATGSNEYGASATGYAGMPPRSRSGLVLDRLGLAPVEHPLRVVVEYSQPNIAKQMHVGHLRSTIIGDVFARVLAFEGHRVILQNHIGDWGTQMGAVILGRWHILRTMSRGGTIDRVRDQLETLKALKGAPRDRARTDLCEICRDWEADVKEPLLDQRLSKNMTLDELELGYTFAQTLAETAKAADFRVPYKDGKLEPLTDLPRKVTQMLQAPGLRHWPEKRAWTRARKISLSYCEELYRRLDVLLQRGHVRGESYYRKRLSDLVTSLQRALPPRNTLDMVGQPWAEVREDRGAVCAFLWDEKGQAQFKTPEGSPLPLIIQKTPEKSLPDDPGAFLYATTDLAAIRFRLKELPFTKTVGGQQILLGVGAQRIIYVTDARQKLHFQMFFAVARAAGWITDQQVDHVTFGSVLGADRKPLKTRAGGTIKLSELLDEAEKRADELLQSRVKAGQPQDAEAESAAPVFSDDERREVARRVGVAALKYADLRNDRNADYVFDWDKMLALQGNTAPYMLYAYARIRSIYRKAADTLGAPDASGRSVPDVYAPTVALQLTESTERALALRLARLRETIDVVAADLTPHILCTYLYDLAGDFMRFYETCPVLQAPDDATRLARLRLCDLTARTLKLALGLLGIETIERM